MSNFTTPLSLLVNRYKDLWRTKLGIDMDVSRYGIITYKGYALLNILESEIIGEEEGLYTRLRKSVGYNRDKSILAASRNEAESIYIAQDLVQGMVNIGLLKRRMEGIYYASADIPRSSEIPLTEDIKKGDVVYILNSSSDTVCGIYHRVNGINHTSFMPDTSIPVPFLYKGASNPVLYFRDNVIARFGRNSRNVISTNHWRWIQSKISMGLTVQIKASTREIPALIKMLDRGNLFHDHASILINGKPCTDAFYSSVDNFSLAEAYDINKTMATSAAFRDDEVLLLQAADLDDEMFPDKDVLGSGIRSDAVMSRIVKQALLEIYGEEVLNINAAEDTFTKVMDYSQRDRFFNLAMGGSKTYSPFSDKFKYTIETIFASMKKAKSTECAFVRNFIIETDYETLVIGENNSFMFSLVSRRHTKSYPFSARGTPFEIKKDVARLMNKSRRRGEREQDTQIRAVRHFGAIADESNAVMLLKLFKVILVSFLTGYKLDVNIQKSKSNTVTKELVKMLSGCYLNQALRVTIDDVKLDTPFAEAGRILIRNNKVHPTLSTISVRSNSGEIVLLNKMNKSIANKDKVLTGRGSPIVDSVEFLYFIGSKLSHHFSSKSEIHKNIDSLGWEGFAAKYL